jgi:hypothetical protein
MRLIALLAATLIACGTVTSAQPRDDDHAGSRHGGTVLFVAQASAARVVPTGSSPATATGVFLVNRERESLTYDITYQDLRSGPPRRIGLYNFGAGGNGDLVQLLCGESGRPCPDGDSGNLVDSPDDSSRIELDSNLLGEFASARIYLEIVGGDGQPEIRGQLEPNGAMVPVRNFVAHLTPARPGASGVGTAVVSEVHLPQGRVSVFCEVTVAGTSGAPRGAALVGVTAEAARAPRTFNRESALPELQLRSSRTAANGGTLSGSYEVARELPDALLASRILTEGSSEVGIVISTSRFTDGELYGALNPVN